MTGNEEPEHRIRRGSTSLASSGLITALVLAVALGGIGMLWSAHLRGRLHKLSSVQVPPETSIAPRPGGQDVLDLHRITPEAGVSPQFTGLTLLPGVGMGILQLTLDLPGRGPVGVLTGTPIEHLPDVLEYKTNQPKPSLVFTPFSLKLASPGGRERSTELLATRPAFQVRTDILPGGTGATATFAPAAPPNPDGTRPPSSPFDTSVTPTISNRGLEITLTARNISDQPQSVSASWSPRFVLPPGGLEKLHLTPPQTQPSTDARPHGGDIALTSRGVHHTWTGLKQSYLSAGPELQLRNLADGYTLRMTVLSPSIRTVQVDADAGDGFLQFRFTSDTAISGEAPQPLTVGPGESLQWRLRIQVSANQTYLPPAE